VIVVFAIEELVGWSVAEVMAVQLSSPSLVVEVMEVVAAVAVVTICIRNGEGVVAVAIIDSEVVVAVAIATVLVPKAVKWSWWPELRWWWRMSSWSSCQRSAR